MQLESHPERPSARSRHTPRLLLVSAAVVVSCVDATAPVATTSPAVPRSFVSGAALAALDETGHFRSLLPAEPSPYPMLADTQAVRIAGEFWRDFGLMVKAGVERDRGAPIDQRSIAPCGRAYFAESPYAAPPDSLSLGARQDLGPRWLVPFCNGRTTQVLLAIPVYAAVVDPATRRTVWVGHNNTIYDWIGVPDGVTLAFSAEEAAIAVATLTGQKVTQVPRLLGVERPIAPWYANWSVTIDHEVMTTGIVSRHRRDVLTYFFGNRPNYGSPPSPRWPLAVQADTNLAPHSASFVFYDLYFTSDGGFGWRPVDIEQRPFPTFGAVEAVTVP